MGNWQLEVAKMGLYMAFPVALFHYFNQPEYFEEWVTRTKREIYPHDNQIEKESMLEAFREIREKRELKYLEELQKNS